MMALIALLAGQLFGGGSSRSLPTRDHVIKAAVALPDFSFVGWELKAVRQLVFPGRLTGLDQLDSVEGSEFVRAYLDRYGRIRLLEEELSRLVSKRASATGEELRSAALADAFEPGSSGSSEAPGSGTSAGTGTAIEEARFELAALRRQQTADRPLVEAILRRQVQEAVRDAGLGFRGIVWPPVHFVFVEPPLKLTVSPRDRISTIHSRVLQAEYDPVILGESENAIEKRTDLRAHITQIGGMAVFPAMVVDSSSLEWALNTIAHEWVHHYLFHFPLGLRYARNVEATTLNETVSDIVGNEIGERVARQYYSREEAGPAKPAEETLADTCACNIEELVTRERELEQKRWERYGRPLPFNFQQAMRETRLHVDALLEDGLVETAEAYMEARRRYFVEKGHPLRVLNQAYFAFHGSYATGAASSSSIGPQLQQLRAESSDLAHFLQQVRWFTSLADLESALGAH